MQKRWPIIAAATGAALAASALFNRHATVDAEQKYPPVGKFIDVDGVSVHYLDRGKGSPIVMLHGSGSLIQDFVVSRLVDALAEHHRVIVLDRPGYGYSARPRDRDWTPEAQAALFVRACDLIGIVRPLVVGHSWGTLPALAWALEHPSQVRALVLMSGYYFGTPRPDVLPTKLLGSNFIGDVLTATIAPLQTRLTGPLGLKMIFSPETIPDIFMNTMPFGLMLRPAQLHATAADSGQMPSSAARLSKRYTELSLPVAILWDDEDKLVGQEGQSARLALELPDALAHPLPGSSHMLHHTRPT